VVNLLWPSAVASMLALVVPLTTVILPSRPAYASSVSHQRPVVHLVAGQGTPEGVVVPNPSECRIEPRSADEVLALYETPEAPAVNQPPPPASPVPFELPPELPEGPPVEPATAAAVSAVWREAHACLNANDYLRLAALTDADSLRRILGTSPTIEEELAADLSVGRPRPVDEREVLPPLSALRMLPDGRVGGLIDLGPPEAPEYAGKNHVIFVREGDRWLIDEVVALIG